MSQSIMEANKIVLASYRISQEGIMKTMLAMT